MSDSYNDSASVGEQFHLLPSSTGSRSVMHLSASSAGNRNEMHLADKSVADLSTDEVAIIFSFLSREDIMRARVCCTNWRDAAKKTLVPLTEFEVNSVRKYNAMRVMSTALPNLQQISLHYLGRQRKYSDGEDPNEGIVAKTANYTPHDIDIISRFSKLRILEIHLASLNGRYPVFFNFPHLQKLKISRCFNQKWDLEMLEGLPSLKDLNCDGNPKLSGNISSLRVLKDTLENVQITNCSSVVGNFMELADFPCLKKFNLRDTAVAGDIRDIREHNFPALELLILPDTIYGRISDVPSFMHTIHLILQRNPTLVKKYSLPKAFAWTLSRHSPDWYSWEDEAFPPPPFALQFVQAGSRRGWRWYSSFPHSKMRVSCETNWLDPEPGIESDDYETYIEELHRIERHNIGFYRGYHQPPNEEEYRRLCGGLHWLFRI